MEFQYRRYRKGVQPPNRENVVWSSIVWPKNEGETGLSLGAKRPLVSIQNVQPPLPLKFTRMACLLIR